MAAIDFQEFARLVRQSAEDGSFVALVLSGPAGCVEPERQDARPVLLGGALQLQWSVRRGRQMLHENLGLDESLARLAQLFGSQYRNAVLQTTTRDISARVSKRGKLLISESRADRSAAVTSHDRPREHIIPEEAPCRFLHEVGVMTAEGRVRAAQQHKFRQINRYLEFVRDIVPDLPADGTIEVVDCGCGKSGLTFALEYFLTQVCRREVHLVGLDWNAAVLETCRGAAERLGLTDIEFQTGAIDSYQPPGPVHLVVSLHACDTATDAALARAIGWEAEVILAAPCCQHELAPQVSSEPLAALLRHGILRERFAADATDALRAALLELHGYRTQVLEFIELEHTPKNLLLRAVRRRSPQSADVEEQQRRTYQELKRLLNVPTFALERLLES